MENKYLKLSRKVVRKDMIKYKYTATVKGQNINSASIKELVDEINATLNISFAFVTVHMLNNYFIRPEKMAKQAAKLDMMRVKRERHGSTAGSPARAA